MDSSDVIVIYSTAPSASSGELARMLVERRLVACVNRTPVRSVYRWEGEICDEEEELLMMKSTRDKAGAVIAAIRELHPYRVPEIIAVPVAAGYGPYLEWVRRETREEKP